MKLGFATCSAFIIVLGGAERAASAGDLRLRAVPLEPSSGNVVATHDINASGVVAGTAGSSNIDPGQHAVLWIDGALSNLDPTFTISYATVLNDAGAAAGLGAFCGPGDGPCASFIARALPGEPIESVGTLGGHGGEVLDINEAGDFAGWWYEPDFVQRAFLHTEQGGLVNLGTLGGFASRANAINESGQVVGSSYDATPQNRAFLWEDGVMSDLGTLGGAQSAASDIGAGGLIVGWAHTRAGEIHAFRMLAGGVMEDIHTIDGAVTSRALVVNDAGVIGGVWNDGSSDFLFIHTEATGTVDLGAPALPFFATAGPIDVNEAGLMVGTGATLVDNYAQPVAWVASLEHGALVADDLVVSGPDLALTSLSAINDAGQMAGIGIDDAFTSVPLVLEPVAPEDIDGDGTVGASDLLALLAAWGACPPADPCPADIDGDGAVGAGDLLALLAAWS